MHTGSRPHLRLLGLQHEHDFLKAEPCPPVWVMRQMLPDLPPRRFWVGKYLTAVSPPWGCWSRCLLDPGGQGGACLGGSIRSDVLSHGGLSHEAQASVVGSRCPRELPGRSQQSWSVLVCRLQKCSLDGPVHPPAKGDRSRSWLHWSCIAALRHPHCRLDVSLGPLS